MFPEKEKICGILGLSLQSTHEEILRAYQEQNGIIDSAQPLDDVERELIAEKRSTLLDSFSAYEKERSAGRAPGIYSIAEAVTRQVGSRSTTMYGFHIPCIIFGSCKVLDCFWNCCCADCSCCADSKRDACTECYDEGAVCGGLKTFDTILAIVGIIAAVVMLITKFGPGIASGVKSANQKRAARKSEKAYRRFVAGYQQQYVPKLKSVYTEWSDLRGYDVDIRSFLTRISGIESSAEISDQFRQMQDSVNAEYSAVEERWRNLQNRLNDLRKERGGEYYMHLNDGAGAMERGFLEMFRQCQGKQQPW